MAKKQSVRIGRQSVALSHLDRVYFPESGLTKGDLVDYYRRIASVALPHWRDRPLSMHRWPEGIDGQDFFQKDVPDYFPDWIDRCTLKKEGGTIDYVLANKAATVVYLANQGCITPHLGLSRVDRIDCPDRLIFDLDPSDGDFEKVRRGALWLREALDDLELAPYVQTTGSRGLHVVVPLDRSADFERVRAFALALATEMATRHPETLTVEQRKAKRGDRVFVDYLRNAYGQTSVAPYAVRAKPGAPVATPLDWEEVDDPKLTARRYTMDNLFQRLAQKTDPWKGMGRHARSLAAAERQLERNGRGGEK